MHIVGIVAEYNPFHNGHAYQIKKARELTNCDALIVAMSGDFVQRGTPAIVDKALRTRMALNNGVDAVLQIPVCYSTASAEAFAYGSVATLVAAGIDTLAFGCETNDENLLYELARLYDEQPAAYKQALVLALKEGLSFPAARSKATVEYYTATCFSASQDKFAKQENSQPQDFSTGFHTVDEITDFLQQPNNILGIEYVKALSRLKKEGVLKRTINVLAIPRIGSDHHSLKRSGDICSASAIRQTLYHARISNAPTQTEAQALNVSTPCKEAGYENFIPSNCQPWMSEYLQKYIPLHENDFSSQLGYCLLREPARDFSSYLDSNTDISNRIINRMGEYESFAQFSKLLQTKDCTYTRISRILTHILLQITSKRASQFAARPVPYIRVLGFRKDSTSVLTYMSEQQIAPLLTNVKNATAVLDPVSYKMLSLDLFARDLYRMTLACKLSKFTSSAATEESVVCSLDDDYRLLIII